MLDVCLSVFQSRHRTIYAESEIIEKRESRTKLDRGIVTIMTRAFNQKNTLVIEFKRKPLAAKKGKGAIPDYEGIILDEN
ncbi:MAG: hypothetical protein VX794_01665 [Nitrospinota bacterium]|nr:hypothetical protein [Nitrospinota bacterium]